MTIRATHKKMISRAVTSSEVGYQVSQLQRLGRPSQNANGHSALENQVSSVSGSCRSRVLPQVGAGSRRLRGDRDVTVLAVPHGQPVAPPDLPRDTPIADLCEPAFVIAAVALGHEVHLAGLAALSAGCASGAIFTNHCKDSSGSTTVSQR